MPTATISDGPPRNPTALRRWLRAELGLTFPFRAMEPGHHSPFDYLAHSFFEGRGSFDEGAEAGALPTDAVVWASRGGGKTFLGAVATMLDLVFKPGIEVRVIAGSFEQASRMHAHLRRLFVTPSLARLVEGNITEKRLALSSGSRVEVLAQSQTAVRGTRVQKIRCDEVELFDPAVWEAAQLATRTETLALSDGTPLVVPGTVECLSTMHRPFGIMHSLVNDANRRIFRWGVLDVLGVCGPERACDACGLEPECGGRAKARGSDDAGHVRIDDALRMKSRVSAVTWDAEMLCRRVARHDSVYPEFEPSTHVVDGAPWEAAPGTAESIIAGMDFGYRAPTVVVLGRLSDDGRLWIVDEHEASETVLDRHIEAVRALVGDSLEWIGVDPAGAQTDGQTGASAVDVLRRSGFRVRVRRLDVRQGIELVRARLRPATMDGPRLFVHRRCASLIRALIEYHYPVDDASSIEPVKDGPDHAADALRYLVSNLDTGRAARARAYVARRRRRVKVRM